MEPFYYKCSKCEAMFLSGVTMDSTLICGEGCGGELHIISEEQATEEVERNYVRAKEDRDYR